MKFIQRTVLGILIPGCLLIFLSYGQEMSRNMRCVQCHEKVVVQENVYQHPPFMKQNCSICHLTSQKSSPEDKNHENRLRTREEIGIKECYGCHPKEKLGVSHPVGVYPTRKIRIPKELPTGINKKLLCITCHSPHGSDEEYLGRKPVSAQLCITCHGKDYYQ